MASGKLTVAADDYAVLTTPLSWVDWDLGREIVLTWKMRQSSMEANAVAAHLLSPSDQQAVEESVVIAMLRAFQQSLEDLDRSFSHPGTWPVENAEC